MARDRSRGSLGALGVAVDGRSLYVAAGADGIQLYDIAHRTRPQKTAERSTKGVTRGIAVAGGFVIIADDHGGVAVLDKSDLKERSRLPLSNEAIGVAVCGAGVLVADGDGGVHLLELRSDGSLFEIGGLATKDFCWGCDCLGGRGYCANDGAGVDILDLSTGAFSAIGSIKMHGEVFGVSTLDDHTCLVCNGRSGLVAVDTRNPTAPVILSSVSVGGEARKARVQGNRCFVAAGFGGVAIVDISNPLRLSVLKQVPNKNYAWEAAVAGRTLYVADGSNGLLVASI